MLNSLADFYDEEIETNLGRFITLVEPMLLSSWASSSPALLLSLYMPLFNMSSRACAEADNRTRRTGPTANHATTEDPTQTPENRRPVRRRPGSERRRAGGRDGAGAPARRALPARVRGPRAVQHRPRAVPRDSRRPDAALRLRALPARGHIAGHRRLGSDRSADDRRARGAARDADPGHGRHAVGDPVDPEEERELAARARGGDRELPAADPARGRGWRRSADRRQAHRRLEPGHPARRHDDLHGHPAARQRHPHRDAGRCGAREVPDRRRAAAGDAADRQALPQHDHLARQGHGGARHRREARAAGRPLQAAAAGQDHRLPRVDHAERARRGRRHPYPRQGIDQRAVPRAAPRHPRVPGGRAAAVPQVHRRAVRHGAGHRPDRQRQDDDALRARCPRSSRSRTRSSPSRIRSNTSCAASRRSRSTRRRG